LREFSQKLICTRKSKQTEALEAYSCAYRVAKKMDKVELQQQGNKNFDQLSFYSVLQRFPPLDLKWF
jgi:hypothetical protein